MPHNPTPAALGYRMPAEWEPHAGTWLAWPHNHETWPDQLSLVQALYLQLIATLQPHETVHLLVNDERTADYVQQQLTAHHVSLQHLDLHIYPTVDAWLRDSGPIFVTSTSQPLEPIAILDWTFTAWGGKYTEMLDDDAIPAHLAAHLNLPRFRPGIALEGGSIDVNGLGTCLTTEQCLLNLNRNPGLHRDDIEHYLHDYLGVTQTIWLGNGIDGDDTDGHVDDIARFVNPTTVVCAVSSDPQDRNYTILQDNLTRLQAATDQDGRPLQVIPLPMPDLVGTTTAPLPASYANFYIANEAVLVPVYGCPHDQEALSILQELFPTRQVTGFPCEPLVWGLGAIHCISQQHPHATVPPNQSSLETEREKHLERPVRKDCS